MAAVCVLHADGEGEILLAAREEEGVEEEVQPVALAARSEAEEEQGPSEGEGAERPAKRKKGDEGFVFQGLRVGTVELMLKQVRVVVEQAGRNGHEGKVQPVFESEQAAPPFVPVERDTVQGLVELNSEDWVREVKERGKQWLTVMLEYVREQGAEILGMAGSINQFRVASYWDGAAHGGEGGFAAFQLDSHLTSDANERACPPGFPHCTSMVPKWDRGQHLEQTSNSMAFFDRANHKQPITEALQRGQLQPATNGNSSVSSTTTGSRLHPVLDTWLSSYCFGTVHSMETERTINKLRLSRGQHTSQFLALAQVGERLQVTPGHWAEWTAKAKATAAARKGDPNHLGFQKRLRDALAAAEAKGGRARRGERSQVSSGASPASSAAQGCRPHGAEEEAGAAVRVPDLQASNPSCPLRASRFGRGGCDASTCAEAKPAAGHICSAK